MTNTKLKTVCMDIDFVVCRGNRLNSDDLFQRIQTDSLPKGYNITANFVEKGGQHTNPIAKIGVDGASEQETVRVIEEVAAIAQNAFNDLRERANIDFDR